MRRPARYVVSAALVGLGMLIASCAERNGEPARTMALGECRLPRYALAAQCGELTVLENRERPEGRKIKLTVAVLPANTLHPQPDPLFVLAGGPGQAATNLGPFVALLQDVRRNRDIVLVDQRGTGRSAPLDCPAWRPERRLETAL